MSAWLGNQQAYNQARANMGQSAAAAFGAMSPAVANVSGAASNAFGANAQALAAMQGSNQMATSQLGQSRNQALAGLGGSMAQLGTGLGGASQVSNVNLGFGGSGGGGGGFRASSPSGPVASGSFSGFGGGGDMGGSSYRGPGPEFAGIANRSFAGMGGLQGGVMDSSVLSDLSSGNAMGMNRLGRSYDAARGQVDEGYTNLNRSFADTNRMLDQGSQAIDAQHASSRSMPMDMFQNSFGNFRQLAGDGYGQLMGGMNQFYGNVNANRANFAPMVNNARDGFFSSSRDLRNLGGRMSGDFRSGLTQAAGVGQGLGNLTQSLGGLGGLMGRFPQPAPAPTGGALSDLFASFNRPARGAGRG
jgi:hypothetical protein